MPKVLFLENHFHTRDNNRTLYRSCVLSSLGLFFSLCVFRSLSRCVPLVRTIKRKQKIAPSKDQLHLLYVTRANREVGRNFPMIKSLRVDVASSIRYSF